MTRKSKNYLTVKNTLLGIVFLIVLMVLSGWIEARLSLTYFSNWKTPLILAIIGALLGLIFCPIFLGAFSENDHLSKSSLKNGLITINFLLVLNILLGLLHKNEFMPGALFFLAVIDIVLICFFFKLKN